MESIVGGIVSDSLSALGAAQRSDVSEIDSGLFAKLSSADLLAELREREILRRQSAVADQALIAELESRGLAGRLVMGSTATMLQGLLILSPHEAGRRVDAARSFAERVSPTGQRLPALRPMVADGQAAGTVSTEQARAMDRVSGKIPLTVAREDQRWQSRFSSKPRPRR